MRQPAISIIVLTYNHEDYIAECLQSIADQTFEDWEAIVVDDGSPDNTWSIVQEFAARDKRIRAVRQANQGIWQIANTINKALALTDGKLIATIGGDDYWPEEKLKAQVTLHQANPNLILSYGRVELIHGGQIIGEHCRPPITGVRPAAEFLRYMLLSQACIAPISAILTRRTLDQIGGYTQEYGSPAEDHPTYIRLLQLPGVVAYLDDLTGYYRHRGGQAQITQSAGTELAEGALQSALNQFDRLPPELRSSIGVSRREIVKTSYQRRILPNSLAQVRAALLARNKRAALGYSRELIRHGDLKRKLQGGYALIAAYFGWTMEPIFLAYEKYILRHSV